MEFLDKIQKILGEHEPSEVDELILDELFIIDELNEDQRKSLEQYDSLLHLSLNKIGLTSLKNLPRISCLQILELRENKLSLSDLSEIITIYPRLIKLKIGGNPITKLENLDVLMKMGELRKIEIKDLPGKKEEEIVEILFENLPNLEVINNKNREGQSVDSTIYEEEESIEIDDCDNEADEDFNEELDEEFEEEIESEQDEDSDENDQKNKKK